MFNEGEDFRSVLFIESRFSQAAFRRRFRLSLALERPRTD